MISQIIAYFGNLERSLLECVAVADYTVLRYEVTSTDGKMRLRAQLQDGAEVDIFEYITLDARRTTYPVEVLLPLAACRWSARATLGCRQPPPAFASRPASRSLA